MNIRNAWNKKHKNSYAVCRCCVLNEFTKNNTSDLMVMASTRQSRDKKSKNNLLIHKIQAAGTCHTCEIYWNVHKIHSFVCATQLPHPPMSTPTAHIKLISPHNMSCWDDTMTRQRQNICEYIKNTSWKYISSEQRIKKKAQKTKEAQPKAPKWKLEAHSYFFENNFWICFFSF